MTDSVYVVGSSGQLGRTLQRLHSEWTYLNRHDLDLSRPGEVAAYFKKKVDVIINAAAFTAVDDAEKMRAEAEQLNAHAARELARACEHLIHISTDYVFSGEKKTPYLETDPTGPINHYGATKLWGEEAAFRENKNTIVIRTSWLYSEYNKNFVRRMLELAETRDKLSIVNDQWGTPTHASDLAQVILQMAKSPQSFAGEIFHYSNEGSCTWYEFAREIFRLAQKSIAVEPIATSAYPTPARRPQYSVLEKKKVADATGNRIPFWQESLERFFRHE
jgi:dTDP-4-dehydrorhamnose reductase